MRTDGLLKFTEIPTNSAETEFFVGFKTIARFRQNVIFGNKFLPSAIRVPLFSRRGREYF